MTRIPQPPEPWIKIPWFEIKDQEFMALNFTLKPPSLWKKSRKRWFEQKTKYKISLNYRSVNRAGCRFLLSIHQNATATGFLTVQWLLRFSPTAFSLHRHFLLPPPLRIDLFLSPFIFSNLSLESQSLVTPFFATYSESPGACVWRDL